MGSQSYGASLVLSNTILNIQNIPFQNQGDLKNSNRFHTIQKQAAILLARALKKAQEKVGAWCLPNDCCCVRNIVLL